MYPVLWKHPREAPLTRTQVVREDSRRNCSCTSWNLIKKEEVSKRKNRVWRKSIQGKEMNYANALKRGPQPWGRGPLLPVCCLLGTGSHSRRWVVGGRASHHLPLPIAPHRSPSLALPPEPPRPPPLPLAMEKLSPTKLVPGAKKVGDHCL